MSSIIVRGVVRNGLEAFNGRALDTRSPLKLPRGESFDLIVDVFTLAGAPVPAAFAERSFTFTVKRLWTPTPVLGFQKTGTVVASKRNRVSFAVAPNDTAALTPGGWAYDVWMITGTARECIVPVSEFAILPSL